MNLSDYNQNQSKKPLSFTEESRSTEEILFTAREKIVKISEIEHFSLQQKVIEKCFKIQDQEDKLLRQGFEKEAPLLVRLHHTNLTKIVDYNNETMCLFFEKVVGNSLQEKLETHQPFSIDEAIRIILQILNGLSYLHQHAMIHCNIYPENIIVTPENQIKITDCGLAKIISYATPSPKNNYDHLEHCLIHPAYASPEQIQGIHLDQRTDLYAVGVLLYYLTTQHYPFDGSTPNALIIKKLHEEPQSPALINSKIMPELNRIILKSLKKEVHSRFQTAEEFAEALTLYWSASPHFNNDGQDHHVSLNFSSLDNQGSQNMDMKDNHNLTPPPQNHNDSVQNIPKRNHALLKWIALFAVVGLGLAAGYFFTKNSQPAAQPVTSSPSIKEVSPQPTTPLSSTPEKSEQAEDKNLFNFDYVKARAEDGDPQAQLLLAMMYREGKNGAPHDLEQAKHWLKESIEGGNEEAQTELNRLEKNHAK